jgi:hypothetical protein
MFEATSQVLSSCVRISEQVREIVCSVGRTTWSHAAGHLGTTYPAQLFVGKYTKQLVGPDAFQATGKSAAEGRG